MKIGSKSKLIEGNDEVRASKCLQAVKEICAQYDCLLVPSMIIQGTQATGININGDVGIVPISRKAINDQKKIVA